MVLAVILSAFALQSNHKAPQNTRICVKLDVKLTDDNPTGSVWA
jgi:hypothetical protein